MTNPLPEIILFHAQINQQNRDEIYLNKINKQNTKNKSSLRKFAFRPENCIKQQVEPQSQLNNKLESKTPHAPPPTNPKKS